MLTLAQFAGMTITILSSDGIDSYRPTLVSRDDQSVRVLEGIPANVDQRSALQDWIIRAGPPSSYLFAVRSELNEVTAGSCVFTRCEFLTIRKVDGRFETSSISEPSWWHIKR